MGAHGEGVLEAEVLPARSRWRRRFMPALACLIGGSLAGGAVALVAWPTPMVRTVTLASASDIEIRTTVAPIYLPVTAAAPPAEAARYRPGSCPEVERGRHSRAGTPIERAPETTPLLYEVTGAAVSSARFGWLAAHDGTTIWLSRDDGKTFRRILDAPGTVRALDVDCFGRVFALRGSNQLGVRDELGERWHRFDTLSLDGDDDYGDGRVRLAANGGYVVVIAPRPGEPDQAMMAISADGGASFRYRDLSYFDGVADLRVTAGGVARAITRWSDCMIEGLNLIEIDLGGDREAVRTIDGYHTGDVRWGADGWVYTTDEQACASGVCAIAPGKRAWRDVRAVPALGHRGGECPDESEGLLAAGHGPTYVQLGGELYRLRRGRGRAVGDSPARGGLTDPQGRLVDASGAELVRWSRRRGTYLLHGQSVDGH